MNNIFKQTLRFIFFFLIQVMVLNQLEIGQGVLIMIYPLFIVLLPVEINIFISLILATFLGLAIDQISNTYGLHASSLLIVAYMRPIIYRLFSPRDGYEQINETNIHTMGFSWFFKAFGLLLLMHHLWFFMFEMFKFNELLYVLKKTLFSVPISFMICILLQYLMIKKRKEK